MSANTRRDVFQAMADPTRREIFERLAERPLTLNGITSHFTISRPAVSQQIKVLEDCGLVTIKQMGRERLCCANFGGLEEAYEWLKTYRPFWKKKSHVQEAEIKLKKKKQEQKSHKKKKRKKK